MMTLPATHQNWQDALADLAIGMSRTYANGLTIKHVDGDKHAPTEYQRPKYIVTFPDGLRKVAGYCDKVTCMRARKLAAAWIVEGLAR